MSPKNDSELKIKTFIDEYRSAEITKLEREVFAQKKRLADAERTLASKPTKAAAESQRIAGNKIELALDAPRPTQGHAAASGGGAHFSAALRAHRHAGGRPAPHAPRAAITAAMPGEVPFVDKQLPGLYNARRDSLGKYWKGLFGVSHAVMLVDSFFENVQRDGKNQVLHFVPRPAGTMLIACLCAEWQDPARRPAPAVIRGDHR